jgi:hypothetical protein
MHRILRWCLLAAVLALAVVSFAQNPTGVRGVIVLVHGVNSGPETYARFITRVWAPLLPETALLEVNWGKTACFHASGSIGERANFAIGMDNKAWDGVAKLKEVVARCRAIVGPDMPITLLGHSQGTVIMAAALQEGLRVDHAVMIGSCLGFESVRTGARNTRLGLAARHVSGTFYNLWSASDQTIQVYKRGIGGFGLPKKMADYTSGNLRAIRIDGVQHTGDDGWWAMGWLQSDYAGAWHGGARDNVLAVLRGRTTAVPLAPDAAANLRELQAFAKTDTSAGWFGTGDRDATDTVFTLPRGLVNGIYYGDKDWCRYAVTCTRGMVRCRIRAALWTTFNTGTDWVTLHAGESATATYTVPASAKDAMVWLQVEGISDEIATADCHFEAEDR